MDSQFVDVKAYLYILDVLEKDLNIRICSYAVLLIKVAGKWDLLMYWDGDHAL